jgi:hypothetical protein
MKQRKYKSPFDFDVSKLTVEEVKERLRAEGIEPNEWTSNEDEVEDGAKAQIPTLKWYADMLKEMGGIVEQQIERDLKETDDLAYQLRRLERGGGR